MPASLEEAKRTAVERYLTTDAPGVFSALAASTAPQQNVTGVGIGPKLTGGQPSGPDCVRLYVERKVPLTALSGENLLPTQIAGVPTDVIESGRFVGGAPPLTLEAMPRAATSAPPGPVRTRIRPVQPGCSVGFQFTGSEAGVVMAGTMGAIVMKGDRRFILSNNHVLANENLLPIGSPIFQPGLLDGGDPAADQVAALSQFVRLDPSNPNLVDCAIAALLDSRLASPEFLPNVGKLKQSAVSPPALHMAVEKVGRTTGFTTGKIFDVQASVKVHYSMGILTFDDQVLVQGDSGTFSAAGDSGSVIVDSLQRQASALLFAGSPAFTIGNKLANVLSALGVTLVI